MKIKYRKKLWYNQNVIKMFFCFNEKYSFNLVLERAFREEGALWKIAIAV